MIVVVDILYNYFFIIKKREPFTRGITPNESVEKIRLQYLTVYSSIQEVPCLLARITILIY